MGLFVQDNYLRQHHSSGFKSVSELEKFADAANFISSSDLVDSSLRQTQNWKLAPFIAAMGCAAPCLIVKNQVNQCQFPGWLGKNSSRNKSYRILASLAQHMARAVSGGQAAISRDYHPLLKHKLTVPLEEQGVDGISEVIEVMKTYHLSREDWDAVVSELGVDMAQVNPDAPGPFKLPTAVKSTFTRRANAELEAHANDPKKSAARITTASMPSEANEEGEGSESKKEKVPTAWPLV
eukprot:TRINITY_DN623_c0_g1_i1.p1 TRINITY_DN623_c0_g1~~TRINITY_DN623_c0_g1_i1.p1  ORF type:complete len:238 (-),score=48.34 TRINITY_DN623_c0_g1_i1:27-740(-)